MKGEIEMKTYLKILALLTVLTVASVKFMTAATHESGPQTANVHPGLLAGPDLRQPENGEAYVPGRTNLSTSGWFDKAIDMCR
mgnify:CR=1 FL=1